ncbi:hypothetical protein EHS39_36615 [Ensifer sp. MPMI2T]|nr:hypothetical protein EHS39_36615 [Ensifer sp. MPMI2T]
MSKRVEDVSRTKSDYRIRRRLVSSLTRDGGLLAADRSSGLIVETLVTAGLFRLRAVLVGTLAFGTYSGLLGVRIPAATIMTGDADFAQDYATSAVFDAVFDTGHRSRHNRQQCGLATLLCNRHKGDSGNR